MYIWVGWDQLGRACRHVEFLYYLIDVVRLRKVDLSFFSIPVDGDAYIALHRIGPKFELISQTI